MLYTESEIASHRNDWGNGLCSGKFRQAGGYLKDSEGGYCCLGVGAELVKDTLNLTEVKDISCSVFTSPNSGYKMRCFLNEELRAYYGLNADSETILIVANDAGLKFPDIAAIIEHLPIELYESLE